MTEEDRVLLDVDYGGFVPREEKRQLGSRWNALAFFFVLVPSVQVLDSDD
jgi:hypothetical protein